MRRPRLTPPRVRLQGNGAEADEDANSARGSRRFKCLVLLLLAGIVFVALAIASAGRPAPTASLTSLAEPLQQQQERRRLEEEVCKCPPPGKQEASDRPSPPAGKENEADRSLPVPKGELSSGQQSAEQKDCDTLAACRDPSPRCGIVEACGGKVFCGVCAFPEWCGGSGAANECGCTPRTCASLQRTCGEAPDGCGGVLTCGKPCTPWSLDPATNSPPPPPQRPYRVGYFASKAQYRKGVQKFEAENIDGRWFTHLIFSAAGVNASDCSLTPLYWNDEDTLDVPKGKWHVFRDVCQLAGTVPMLSVGGPEFLEDKKGGPILSRCVENEEERKKLAASIINWLIQHKYEGIELDWVPTTSGDAEALLELLVDLREQFDQLSQRTGKYYWLSVKAPADPVKADVAFPNKVTLASVVDWVAVATVLMHQWRYDGSTPSVTSQAGIRDDPGCLSIATVIAHWRREGVPTHRLIIELITNAVVWKLKEKGKGRYGAEADGVAGNYKGPMVPYIQLASQLAKYRARDILHVPTSSAYAFGNTKWASYDSPATAALKVDYVVQQKLGGYILCIDQDSRHELSKAASQRTKPTYPIVPSQTGNVMLVSSGYGEKCADSEGTLFVMRALNNKVEYARRHNMRVLYNEGTWNGKNPQMLSKVHILKNALLHHPEVEWFMWMDADAFFTDLSFNIPFDSYRSFNLVVPGFWKRLFEKSADFSNKPKWARVNSGVFLIRNCAWSVHILELWAEYAEPLKAEEYRALSKAQGRARGQPPAEQRALVYLLHSQAAKLADLTFFEDRYSLHGIWGETVPHYRDILRSAGPRLRWDEGKRPSFVTHFTGCNICRGTGGVYEKAICTRNVKRALNFADNQALLQYNMSHANLMTPHLQDL